MIPYIWNLATITYKASQVDIYINTRPTQSFSVDPAALDSSLGSPGEWFYAGSSKSGDKFQGYLGGILIGQVVDDFPNLINDYIFVPDCFSEHTIMDFGDDFIDIDLRWYEVPPKYFLPGEGH